MQGNFRPKPMKVSFSPNCLLVVPRGLFLDGSYLYLGGPLSERHRLQAGRCHLQIRSYDQTQHMSCYSDRSNNLLFVAGDISRSYMSFDVNYFGNASSFLANLEDALNLCKSIFKLWVAATGDENHSMDLFIAKFG